MKITVAHRKLARALEDEATCIRQYGLAQAKKIAIRMASLDAAESLATFWPPLSGPERCHQLVSDLAGNFSIDVKQPYRLLFRAVDAPASEECEDERQRWAAIKAIEIVAIEDTHG